MATEDKCCPVCRQLRRPVSEECKERDSLQGLMRAELRKYQEERSLLQRDLDRVMQAGRDVEQLCAKATETLTSLKWLADGLRERIEALPEAEALPAVVQWGIAVMRAWRRA
jgi:hypothetical protein